MKNFHLSLMLVGVLLLTPFSFAYANMLPDDTSPLFIVALFGVLFIVPVLVNIAIEAIAGFVYTKKAHKPMKILIWHALANIFTYIPFFLAFNDNDGVGFVVVAEVIIVCIEASVIRLAGRKYMTWKDAWALSTVANLVSLVCGVLLNGFLSPFIS